MVQINTDLHIINVINLHINILLGVLQNITELLRPEIKRIRPQRFLIGDEVVDHLVEVEVVGVALEAVVIATYLVVDGFL
jgi:hypothetical protein